MKGKVVVCGIETEEPVSLLLDSLQAAEADFLFIDQRDFAGDFHVRWQMTRTGVDGVIKVNNRSVRTNQISSVFMRMLPVEMIEAINEHDHEEGRVRSATLSLVQLFDALTVRVINHRRPMMSNNSKPYQSLLIREAGFSIPDTLITSDPRRLVNSPLAKSPIIFKSMSSTRSIVKTADLSNSEKLKDLNHLPTQFQEKIEGYCARIHVIGETVIGTRIHSTATDYRYAALENKGSIMAEMPLNTDLHRKCVNLAGSLGLNFCGIDLMISNDRIVCLEVNPCPGYSYYQKATGQPISDALAAYLMHETG